MKSIKISIIGLSLTGLVACSGFLSCSKDKDTTKKELNNTTACDFSNLESSEAFVYDFSTAFSQHFIQSPRWESNQSDIRIVAEKGQLTAQSTDVSSALEAWKLYKKQMPYNRSWEIAVDITIPLYWNSNGGKNAQVGAGLFVGKPVASGQSSKVYECNMAAINGDVRFAQAQLVANRLGDDPIDVQFKELPQSSTKLRMKVTFCSQNKSLSLYIDNKKVGKSQAIDQTGLDNWKISETGLLDVGIMGFAENTVIASHQPTLDNFEYKIYQ